MIDKFVIEKILVICGIIFSGILTVEFLFSDGELILPMLCSAMLTLTVNIYLDYYDES